MRNDDPHGIPGSSPHTRGAPPRRRSRHRRCRIIPAYAGSTPMATVVHPDVPDHPRIRGEHRSWRRLAQQGQGSSPHTRGALVSGGARPGRRRDHPRIRGEHRPATSWAGKGTGSSPHTRGALATGWIRTNSNRIIPAYAGSTDTDQLARVRGWDHPRIRGEHKKRILASNTMPGSSPHTRGARVGFVHVSNQHGIIPAYAGSTWSRYSPRKAAMDHPRIRGEHPLGRSWSPSPAGSSPHTRGAHV